MAAVSENHHVWHQQSRHGLSPLDHILHILMFGPIINKLLYHVCVCKYMVSYCHGICCLEKQAICSKKQLYLIKWPHTVYTLCIQPCEKKKVRKLNIIKEEHIHWKGIRKEAVRWREGKWFILHLQTI